MVDKVAYTKIDFITNMFQPLWWYSLYPTNDIRSDFEFMKKLEGQWIIRTERNQVTGDSSFTEYPRFLEKVTPTHIYHKSKDSTMVHISEKSWIDKNWVKVDQVWIENNNLNGFRQKKAV